MAEGGGSQRSLDAVLATAIRAAREAGNLIQQAWWSSERSAIAETKSSDVDLVTETDQKCEALVSSIILKDFPDDRIIGEEACGSGAYEELTDDPTWTIDPIDGTTNFVHRFPQSCVIIAYIEKKQTCASVIYDPVLDELFWAKKGAGAWVENPRFGKRQLRSSGTKTLDRALVSMEVGYGRDDESISMVTNALVGLMKERVRSIRMAGSSGLNMAYVAAGRFDCAFEHGDWPRGRGPKIWDFAAGKLIVAEAGGVSRDLFKGGANSELDLMGRAQFTACTAELANAVLAIARPGGIGE